jgi:hypothetical protein
MHGRQFCVHLKSGVARLYRTPPLFNLVERAYLRSDQLENADGVGSAHEENTGVSHFVFLGFPILVDTLCCSRAVCNIVMPYTLEIFLVNCS